MTTTESLVDGVVWNLIDNPITRGITKRTAGVHYSLGKITNGNIPVALWREGGDAEIFLVNVVAFEKLKYPREIVDFIRPLFDKALKAIDDRLVPERRL